MNEFNSKVFDICEKEGVTFLKIPAFEATGLVNHCFSTKRGGVSEGIFESMNLGLNRGDTEENVHENFRRLCSAIGVQKTNLVFTTQVHEDKIISVEEKDRGKGLLKPNNNIDVDGIMTDKPQVALTTFYADCVPLYFLDPVKKVIAISHAGWRGTVKGIGAKTVEMMHKQYGSAPKDILAAIGPSIGPCCFEVSIDVKEEFDKVFNNDIMDEVAKPHKEGKYLIDLWAANEYILLESGILKANITKTDLCTMCHKDVLFSHRGSKGQRGSLAAIMELK